MQLRWHHSLGAIYHEHHSGRLHPQTSPNNSSQPAVTVSLTSSGNSTPAQGTGAYVHGHFMSNETRLEAAAQTLGVSESDLINALTPPAQEHVINFTYTTAQLSAASGTTITSAQLMAALGMYTGVPRNSTRQMSGQNAATNGGKTPSNSTPYGP